MAAQLAQRLCLFFTAVAQGEDLWDSWDVDMEQVSLLQLRMTANHSTGTRKMSLPGHMVNVFAASSPDGGWPAQSECVADFRYTYVLKNKPTDRGLEKAIYSFCLMGEQIYFQSPRVTGAYANVGVRYEDLNPVNCDGIGRLPTFEELTMDRFAAWRSKQQRYYLSVPIWSSTPCQAEVDVPLGSVWAVDGRADLYHAGGGHGTGLPHSGRKCMDPTQPTPAYVNLGTMTGVGVKMSAACCNKDGSLPLVHGTVWNGRANVPSVSVERAGTVIGGRPCAPSGSWWNAQKNPSNSLGFLEAAAHCSAYDMALCPASATTSPTKMGCGPTWTSTPCDPTKKCGGTTGVCYGTGDPHYASLFYNPRDIGTSRGQSFNAPGLFGVVKSKDQRIRTDMFTCPGYPKDRDLVTTASYNYAFAFQIESTTVVLLRDVLLVDGVPVITPKVMEADGFDVRHDMGSVTVSVHKHIDNDPNRQLFFFKIKDNTGCFSAEIHYTKFASGMVRHIEYYYSMILEMPLDEVQDASGICTRPSAEDAEKLKSRHLHDAPEIWRLAPEASLFSLNQLAQIKAECHLETIDPPSSPEVDPEENCEINGIIIADVQAKCSPLLDHDFRQMYDDCIYDGCADAAVIDDIIIDDLAIEEETEEIVECADDDKECLLVEACDLCPSMDFSNSSGDVVSGLKFAEVTSFHGQAVDLTVTGNPDEYTGKDAKNGAVQGGPWAQINVKGKGQTTFLFRFTDTTTGEDVTMPSVCMSIFDLDHGKKPDGEEFVQSCAHTNVATSTNTELAITKDGLCDRFASTTPGTGADNPQQGVELTDKQKQRTLTMIFNNKSQFEITMGVAGKIKGYRNFIFAGDATMACDAKEFSAPKKGARSGGMGAMGMGMGMGNQVSGGMGGMGMGMGNQVSGGTGGMGMGMSMGMR